MPAAPKSDRRAVRLFVAAAFAPDAVVTLGEAQAHYVRHVMRLSVGDGLRVFNGRDGEWTATLAAVAKKSCTVRLAAQTRCQEPTPDLWLAFAPLKRARVDLLVEKATELGVAALCPVVTQHAAAERVNVDRLRAIAVEAAEQCERLTVPEVRAPGALAEMLAQWPPARRLYVLDETGAGVPLAAGLDAGASQPCAFLVGPEGGFAQSELDALARLPFVSRVGLGPRILRAETAALAALVIWQSRVGDWR
jgi:16S rRNA (uracil1498-N3)-methyltransferase